MKSSADEITQMCDEIKQMLLDKNKKYGDSALEPIRFFSQASPIEQILVRIDDKLNRIKQGSQHLTEDEDVISDLIGYFILFKIACKRDTEDTRGLYYKPMTWNKYVDDYIDKSEQTPYTGSDPFNPTL